MAKAGQAFENPVMREQKVFNQTAYELVGTVLDIECNILSVARWQPRFALAYNYSVNHIWTCGCCRPRRGYASRRMLELNEEEGKRWGSQGSLAHDHAAAGA
jgi:hypothetical protein